MDRWWTGVATFVQCRTALLAPGIAEAEATGNETFGCACRVHVHASSGPGPGGAREHRRAPARQAKPSIIATPPGGPSRVRTRPTSSASRRLTAPPSPRPSQLRNRSRRPPSSRRCPWSRLHRSLPRRRRSPSPPPLRRRPSPSPRPPPQPPSTPPAVHCDLYASPAGSDSSGNGSIGSPYASVGKLDAALHAGQTGCLRAGSYGSTSTWVKVYTNGSSTGQITITSYPGETATVRGYVDIEAILHDAVAPEHRRLQHLLHAGPQRAPTARRPSPSRW